MKYIGNKTRLLPFIEFVLQEASIPTQGRVVDPFAGTASVALWFKALDCQIYSSDIMNYSFLRQKALIEMSEQPQFLKLKNEISMKKTQPSRVLCVLDHLNSLIPSEGYVFENYAPSGAHKRQYFTDQNAMRIDVIRETIQTWFDNDLIDFFEFAYLVSTLIESADHVANMSGTYGAYLKIWRSVALKRLILKPFEIISTRHENRAHLIPANDLLGQIDGEILYLDPPYNTRQYASNFHVLESIAVWDKQPLKGKTGLRNYESQKSDFSSKTRVKLAFEDLINHSNFKYILLSYSNEGIMDNEFIWDTLSTRGKVNRFELDYRRFRTERDHEKRNYRSVNDRVSEYIYLVKCS